MRKAESTWMQWHIWTRTGNIRRYEGLRWARSPGEAALDAGPGAEVKARKHGATLARFPEQLRSTRSRDFILEPAAC